MNTQILNMPVAGLDNVTLMLPEASAAKTVIDAVYGSVGGGTLDEPFYKNRCWFVMNIEDTNGVGIPGLTVAVAPAGPIIKYNNGSDAYESEETAANGTMNMPQIGGYTDAANAAIYTFTTSETPPRTAKLPLVPGEAVFTNFPF